MKTLFAALLFFLSYGSLLAQQNPQPYFRNYSTENGLPSPETYCTFQDSRGYVWFGTDNGACRFDGYEFVTFGSKDGLSSNVVFDIFEDRKGRIWFGTMTGEAFIWDGDTIHPYRFNHLIAQYKGQFDLATLSYLSKDETAYFEMARVGILRIDSLGTDSLITTQRSYSRLILDLKEIPKVMRISVSKPQRGNQIYKWRDLEKSSGNAFIEIITDEERLSTNLPFFQEQETSYYFTSQKLSSDNLLYFNMKHLYCLQNNKLLWVIPFDLGPKINVNEIIEDEQGAIWLCLAEGLGLRRYRDLDALKNGIYDQYFEGLSIANMLKDAQGAVWVNTQEKGIFYCPDLQSITYESSFGLSDNFVSSVTIKNKNEVFAGCQNGDIFLIDIQQNHINEKLTAPLGYRNPELFYHAKSGRLWCDGVYWKDNRWDFVQLRNLRTNRFSDFTQGGLKKMHINEAGELLGCNRNRFYFIDINNDTVKLGSNISFSPERSFALHTDLQQHLWVGNNRGIFEFKDSLLHAPNIDHPAFRIRVEDIDELADSSLVFGTKGLGIVRWKGEDILQITTDDGLTANMIEDVHVDENDIIWVGTLNGLNKVTFDSENRPVVRQFTMANGLPSNEIYQIKSYEGQVWLCTAGGLVKFHEAEAETVSTAPIIQYVHVNSAPVSLINDQRFSYQQNNLEFRYLTINYRQNGQIPYRYRLNETDDWQYTQNLSVNYPKLPPGDYRLEVQSQNQDGFWSAGTQYAFSIQPPWWDTWWARGIAGLLVLAGVVYFQRQVVAKVRKEAAIQRQIDELERSALQAQMNPHFIFNCLNSIQNFILQNDRKRAVEYLSRFAQLVRHNLNASVQGKVSLEEELGLLDNYLALEQERFEHRFDYELKVAADLNQQFIAFPPLLIQPYVENAIIHGLSKKEEKGKVEVHFTKENGHLAVSIRDNGPGYQPDQKKKRSGKHKSVGMSITQKRLELLGESPEKVVQISTLNGEEGISGTEVKIFIDLNQRT